MPVGMHRPKPSKWKNVWPFLAILVIVPALGWAAATALSRQPLAQVLKSITGPRDRWGVRHDLLTVLSLAVTGVLAGAGA